MIIDEKKQIMAGYKARFKVPQVQPTVNGGCIGRDDTSGAATKSLRMIPRNNFAAKWRKSLYSMCNATKSSLPSGHLSEN
jgi:hypothetical protein